MDDYAKLDTTDPELANELRRIQRRKAISDMMLKQSMSPIQGQMVGNRYIPPSIFQGLAQLGEAYFGTKAGEEADQGYKALGEKRKAIEEAAMSRYQQGVAGTPERPSAIDPQEIQQSQDQGTALPPNIPAQVPTQEQKLAAIREAMLSSSPRLAKMGQFDFSAMNAEQARKDAAQAKLEQLKMQVEAKVEAEKQRAAEKENLIRLAASLKPPQDARPTTIADPNNPNETLVIDANTKKILGKGPKLTQTGTAEQKKQLATEADQKAALQALRTAGYDPSTGKDKISDLIDASTSGAVERAGAAVPGAFGVSTSGMKALRTVESTANSIVLDLMNRKLGAGISNADRDFIVSQLGDVGNAMKPAGERKAAWTAARNRMIEVGLHPAVGGNNASIPDAPPPGAVRRK